MHIKSGAYALASYFRCLRLRDRKQNASHYGEKIIQNSSATQHKEKELSGPEPRKIKPSKLTFRYSVSYSGTLCFVLCFLHL
jgi:hypothetical protein